MTDKNQPDWIWLAIGGIITLGLTILGIKNQTQTTSSTPTPAPITHRQGLPSSITPSPYHHDVSNIAYGSSYNTRNGNGDCGCGL